MSREGANLRPENLRKNRITAFSSTENNTAKGITQTQNKLPYPNQEKISILTPLTFQLLSLHPSVCHTAFHPLKQLYQPQ